MKFIVVMAAATAIAAVFACRAVAASSGLPPLQTVEYVDLNRYLGEWYEIARYPNKSQKGCLGSKTNYSLRENGELDVLNSCRDAQDGKLRQAKGRAWIVDPVSNARLKASFFWPFRSDYWIIDVGKEYEYAVIGTPNRKYLWILSRTPAMDSDVYEGILQRIEKQGFVRGTVIKSENS